MNRSPGRHLLAASVALSPAAPAVAQASGFTPGDVLHGQSWFRDPPNPVSGSGLSNGATFTLRS